jgi:hypothetical protein
VLKSLVAPEIYLRAKFLFNGLTFRARLEAAPLQSDYIFSILCG